MQINTLIPSWETALSLAGPAIGTVAGVASRVVESLPLNKALCRPGFGQIALDGINTLGQLEIKTYALLTPVVLPLAGKVSSDAYSTGKVWEALKQNISKGQAIAGGAITALGFLGSCGYLKPLMQSIYSPWAPAGFDPSGHFLTKILTSALSLSLMKSLLEKSSPEERKALITWYALNAIKDTVLLTATIANHCHSIPEVAAGSLLGCALLAGAYSLWSEESETKEPSIKIKAEGPNQFRVCKGEENALVDFETGEIREGSLPPRILKAAIVWANSYKKELQEQPSLSLFSWSRKGRPKASPLST